MPERRVSFPHYGSPLRRSARYEEGEVAKHKQMADQWFNGQTSTLLVDGGGVFVLLCLDSSPPWVKSYDGFWIDWLTAANLALPQLLSAGDFVP